MRRDRVGGHDEGRRGGGGGVRRVRVRERERDEQPVRQYIVAGFASPQGACVRRRQLRRWWARGSPMSPSV